MRLTPDGSALLFLRSGPADLVQNLYEMDLAGGQVRSLARAEGLLAGRSEKITAEEKARAERSRQIGQGLRWYELSEDGSQILTGINGRLFVIRRADGETISLPDDPAGPALDARFSPDGRWVACVRNHNLHVIEIATRQERALTQGGTDDRPFAEAEFVAQEEMDRRTGYWWTGDSNWIAYTDVDQRDVERFHIADPFHPESPPQVFRYPRAGRKNADVRLGLVSVAGGETRWVEWDRQRYPYLATVRSEAGTPLTLYVQTRDQKEGLLSRLDPATGELAELLRERDAAWINLDERVPRWLADGGQFLWTTERNGRRELELRDASGALVRTVRIGQAELFEPVALDSIRREAVVRASANPTEAHLYRVSIDRDEIVALTQGPGVFDGVFAKEGALWIKTSSLPNGSIEHQVMGRDAAPRRDVPSVAKRPHRSPAFEVRRVAADGREYYVAIVRPHGFKSGRRYPVIVYVYGGPGTTVVTAAGRSYLRQQWLADQGFIVVSIDGRGTPRRGREWERAIAGNVIDPPLADQVAALRALGEACDELDLSRVGIYGWSFGGYFSAMAITRRPDVFAAAVAGAPVVDWADYDTHYSERYMGLPDANRTGYQACNVLTYAAQLARPLLLIHGTADDNVYFFHSLKLCDVLLRAGAPHELMMLPGQTHLVREPDLVVRIHQRIAEHFLRHLATAQPRSTPP